MKAIRILIATVVFIAISGPSSAADKEALKEMTATIINLNGLLCAKVVDIRPLKVRPDVYEVTCIEYRGGTGQKTYIMDAAKGKAWVP